METVNRTVVEAISYKLIEAIESDAIILPTLPEVALRIREATQDPDVSARELAKVLAYDTAISARLIKVSNSPLLRGSVPTTDLQMAISRLGIDYTCNLATGLAMEHIFQATSDLVDKHLRETWNRSTEIAGISFVLTEHFTNLPPDKATLAGLIHKIGVLPILTFAEDHSFLLEDPLLLDQLIELLHPGLGSLILRHWDFSEDLIQVPEEYLDFYRKRETVDYADIILVANLQSDLAKHPETEYSWENISAFSRLGFHPELINNDMEWLDDLQAAQDTFLTPRAVPDSVNTVQTATIL